MHITVRPRYVAAPWEPESTLRIVGLEDDVTPEAGPLELYLPHLAGSVGALGSRLSVVRDLRAPARRQ
jgi:hypothetical protein